MEGIKKTENVCLQTKQQDQVNNNIILNTFMAESNDY